MNRFKIKYTTGNGQYDHQSIVSAREGVTGAQAAGTLIAHLAKQGVKAVLTQIMKV